jgi:hypothetical protein
LSQRIQGPIRANLEQFVVESTVERSVTGEGGLGSENMGTKDPRADAEKYLEKHNVRGLFKHLSTKVLFAKPEDPKAFLVQELKRVQECQQEQKPVSLLLRRAAPKSRALCLRVHNPLALLRGPSPGAMRSSAAAGCPRSCDVAGLGLSAQRALLCRLGCA